MRNIKKKTIIVFSFIVLTSLLSSFNVSSSDIHSFSNNNLELPDSYIIKDVPYVSQETNFFCSYASSTMVFKYYGINLSLEDVLYHTGVGYSTIYRNKQNFRIPRPGWFNCQTSLTYEFISDLYGLSYEPCLVDSDLSDKEQWIKEWTNIKQNISNDIPIVAYVDELVLAADNLGFGIFYPLLKNSNLIFGHAVTILGYNETNQSICYNDPIYGVYDKSDYGIYRWADVEKFKTSTRRISNTMWVHLFIDISEKPVLIEEAFNRSHKRNIEKLKGNSSIYSDNMGKAENTSFGINAVRRLRQDFDKGINNRVFTFYKYKLYNRFGLIYSLMNYLHKRYSSVFKITLDMIVLDDNDIYTNIAGEKNFTADYLNKMKNTLSNENLSEICEYESTLFKYEAENWTKMAEYYSEFRKKGIFMPLLQGLNIMNKMADALDNIIAIEEAIISGPPEEK